MWIKNRGVALAVLCALAACPGAWAQSGGQLSFSLAPAAVLPFHTDPLYFTPGGDVTFTAEYRFPVVGFLGVRADLGAGYLPIWTGDGCALFAAAAGPSIHFPNAGGFTSSLFATAGYYYGIIADTGNESGGNLLFSAGTRLGWNASPSINIGAEAAWRFASDGAGGALYQGVGVGVSARYSLLRASPLRLRDLRLDEVFPVLLTYYDTHPVGKVVVENGGSAPVRDLEVSLFVEKYMDNPTQCPVPPTLGGGQAVTVDLFALLSEKALAITESTVLSAKVAVSCTQEKKRVTIEKSASLYMKDRNAMTWDDDRKVAAFVLAKDPAVLDVAKTTARIVTAGPPCIDANLGTAMALHEALRLHGMSYVVDPTSAYTEHAKNRAMVDYIQFPRATLQYRSGDCDDLTVLSAAILQGVGIDTAFITVPGHIYLAVALKVGAAQARRLFSNPSLLIVREERAWVPVEITMTGSPFLDAWATGAAEWRENESAARLLPVAEAWQTYAPVSYSEDTRSVSFVPETAMASAYATELARFTDRELAAHGERVRSAAGAEAGSPATLNRLAVLSAQFGRMAEAKVLLRQALAQRDYLPALVNLANLLYLEADYPQALSWCQRAIRVKSDDAAALLRLAQVQDKLGNGRESAAAYRRLSEVDPGLAARFSYLDPSRAGGARAADRGSEREAMTWVE